MDYFRGFTSSSLDVALQILQKKIKTGEDQNPFRAHTTRDIDDSIANVLANILPAENKDGSVSKKSSVNHPVDFSFMVLAGERASRISKDSMEELCSQQVVEFAQRLEAFFSVPRPAEEKAAVIGEGGKKSKKQQDGGAQGTSSEDDQKRPEPVNTHLDSDSQTAIAYRHFAQAVRFYGDWAIKIASRNPSVARRGLNFLNLCIENWRPAQGHLTTAHACLVELALKTHNAYAAVAFGRLEEPIYEINPNLSGCTIFDYLDYYYFGGLCYASLQRWGESADMLEQVTLAPAQGLSVRTIAAVKAHLLVTSILLGDGVPPDGMRKGKYLQEVCREYFLFVDQVSKAVSTKNFDMGSFTPNFPSDAASDGLIALAQQAVTSIPYHRARNLTRTYLTVSLASLGAECGGSEAAAEARVREMVLNKQLDCTVDRANKVVTFSVAGSSSSTDNNSSSNNNSNHPYEATTEEQALRNIMEVNKLIAQRQDIALLAPGHVLAVMNTQDLGQAAELTKKELESEKGGLLGAFRR